MSDVHQAVEDAFDYCQRKHGKAPRDFNICVTGAAIVGFKLTGQWKIRLPHLSGAIAVDERAKPRCFREFRGRGPLIEQCLESVKKTTGLVVETGMPWRDAVDRISRDCLKIKNLNDQTACIVGATEVLLKSAGYPQSLEGRKKKRRR